MASLTEVVDDYLKRLKQCECSGVWMQMKTKGRQLIRRLGRLNEKAMRVD